MSKSHSAWGIEIGAYAVKAIRLSRDGDQVTVEDFAYIRHAQPLTTPDCNAIEATRLTLQQFITAKNLDDVKTVVSLPGHVGLARFAKLPPVEPKMIPNIVRFEAEQQIPFPIGEVEWDFQTFTSDDNPEVEVGIFAVTKKSLAERLGLYAEFGIRPEIVTLGPLAAFNAIAYDHSLTGQYKPIVVVDLGTQSSDVIVMENGRCWIRTFPLGGTHFTDALVELFKVKYVKADRLKTESASSKYARQMMQAMRPVFGDLVTDIQRSMGHYQMSHRDHPIEQVYGIGSTFRIPGLRKFLSQQLNVQVDRVDEFKRIRVEGRDAADFAANTVNFVTAYGLALQGVGLGGIQVNLVPLQTLRDKLWSTKNRYFVAAASVAIAGSAALFIRPVLDQQKFDSGSTVLNTVKQVISQGDSLKRQLVEVAGVGETGSTEANIRMLSEDRSIWPMIVRDACAATLSTAPTAALAAPNAKSLAAMPPESRRLISLQNLSGEYAFVEEGAKRTITVSMQVEFSHTDDKAATFLTETVGKWFKEHADQKDVPFTIRPDSIKIETKLLMEVPKAVEPPPEVAGTPGKPPPPNNEPPPDGQGGKGGRGGRGGSGSGSDSSGSGGNSGDASLDSKAPIELPGVLYSPGSRVFSGEIKYVVEIRGATVPTPATEGTP